MDANRQPNTSMMTVKLKSGATMPVLGLGTWQLNGDECVEAVSKALALGYRHIDTAEAYENHEEVRAGIARSGVPRKDLFITSKLMHGRYSRRNVIEACDVTLKELGVDYLDLYLIHWPDSSYPMDETLDAMGGLIDAGKVRDIGVSNFTVSHIAEVEKASKTPISVNQVEYHIYLNQENLLSECSSRGIVLTAYCPLARSEWSESGPHKRRRATSEDRLSGGDSLAHSEGTHGGTKARAEAHERRISMSLTSSSRAKTCVR